MEWKKTGRRLVGGLDGCGLCVVRNQFSVVRRTLENKFGDMAEG